MTSLSVAEQWRLSAHASKIFKRLLEYGEAELGDLAFPPRSRGPCCGCPVTDASVDRALDALREGVSRDDALAADLHALADSLDASSRTTRGRRPARGQRVAIVHTG